MTADFSATKPDDNECSPLTDRTLGSCGPSTRDRMCMDRLYRPILTRVSFGISTESPADDRGARIAVLVECAHLVLADGHLLAVSNVHHLTSHSLGA